MTRRRGFVVHAPLLAPYRDDKSGLAPISEISFAPTSAPSDTRILGAHSPRRAPMPGANKSPELGMQ